VVSRLTVLGAIGVVVGLALVVSAGGALEVRLTTSPSRPAALESTRITLRSYLPLLRADGSCCTLEPGGPKSYPFRVEAVSPKGKISRISIRRTEANVWHGAFRFPIQGRWRIQVANYGPSYRHAPGAQPRIEVDVGVPIPTPPPAGFGSLGRRGAYRRHPRMNRHEGSEMYSAPR
jgi:hypothetical protein